LVVNALNTEERLGEALGDGAIGHPLRVQLLADLDVFVGNFEALMLWEVGEQRDEAKGVVHVSQGILECRIALSDHVAQGILGHLLHVILCLLEFPLSLIFLVFLEVCFYVSEFLQQSVVFQDFEVLEMEVGLVISLELSLWLSWINSFQNA